ncbi:MAG: pyruvate ferredoxin oxidoreductase [Coriobacteriia bacterium]|nr:pyruvate ferredoxin oxidoreductase [Coriobacteriia bacterium]
MSVRVMTGNDAAATAVKLARTQVIAAYPITPQSPVVESLSTWVESGELPAEFVAVESEHSALSVCIGASTVGARAFTATSANGLAYMTEQVWWAAGARLPIVMCVANRAMAAPWSVLNDQQDSMSVRDAGWVQLYCRDNQEILDTTVQAFHIAEELNVPVMVCYDGFLLSHTMMPVDVPDAGTVDGFLPPRTAPLQIVDTADPRNVGPVTLADPRPDADGVLQPGYMEFRAMHHAALLEALDAVPAADRAWAGITGRSSGGLLSEYLLDDADTVLVAAGSLVTQLTLVADELRAEGVRAGVLGIRCYRPFPVGALRDRLAGRSLAVVFDKALSYGYQGPICEDLKAALYDGADSPAVHGVVCGLGGRDVTPVQLASAVREARADLEAGIRDRAPYWIGLVEGSMR